MFEQGENKNKPFDTIICGGGPSGSTCAYNLAKKGRNVLIIDKAKFPRHKVCAGWITPRIFEYLDFKPADYPHTLTMGRYHRASIVLGDKYHVTEYGKTSSFAIIRREFDEFLVRRAQDAGAHLLENIQIKSMEVVGDEIARVISSDGRSWYAKLIIAAGGTRCPLAIQLGAMPKGEHIIIAVETEVKVGAERLKQLSPHHPSFEVFPEDDYFGYGWYWSKGDWLNIGIGRYQHKTNNLNHAKDVLVERLKKLGRLDGVKLEPFLGHTYRLHDTNPRKISGERYLIIGDAAGFSTRWAGEGIRPAIETGYHGAQVADKAISENNFSEIFLSSYNRVVRKGFGSGSNRFFRYVYFNIGQSIRKLVGDFVMSNSFLRKNILFNRGFYYKNTDL